MVPALEEDFGSGGSTLERADMWKGGFALLFTSRILATKEHCNGRGLDVPLDGDGSGDVG